MKGLRSLDAASAGDVVPTYVAREAFMAPQDAFQPAKKPLKAVSEMSREERHSAHLRKRRQAKAAKRTEEARQRVMAKFDPKTQAVLAKKEMMQTLAGNKNVTVIGTKGGGKWKHSLSQTLARDRMGANPKNKASADATISKKAGKRTKKV